MQGIDYSWARPGGAAIKAAGFTFAMRYVPYSGDGGKGLTKEELDDLHANGISVGLVFESTAGRMLEGFQAGREDALVCVQAFGALGFPEDRPAYFACDFDAQPHQFPELDDYLRGAGSVLGAARVGVYGGFNVIEHCTNTGSCPWGWQTYAWSGGRVSDNAAVYQYLNGQELNGGAVDYCEGRRKDFGQWPVEDDMTKDETIDLICQLFLPLLEQAVGTKDSTFSDTEAIARVRAALKSGDVFESFMDLVVGGQKYRVPVLP